MKQHVVTIDHPVTAPEEGIIIGNGSLSASVYQKDNCTIWRLGKNDVWDRRFDRSDDPTPAHINEIARGLTEEGWTNHSFESGPVESKSASSDPERMRQICSGPPSYSFRPYPCPKPVGELALHLPADQGNMRILQQLVIEEGKAAIHHEWPAGVAISVHCFIPPDDDVIVIRWDTANWTDTTATGRMLAWFSAWRWPDPPIREFAHDWLAKYHSEQFLRYADPKATPLPPPSTRLFGTQHAIEQTFHADPDSSEGFRYAIVPIATGLEIKPVNEDLPGARLHMTPGRNTDLSPGIMVVGVPSGNDAATVEKSVADLTDRIGKQPADVVRRWSQDTLAAAADFWKRSSITTGDSTIETTWYETLHIRRCAFRDDTIAPGLFLPSTVNDYSHWHGDYHSNYNYQQPFWGGYEANQISLGDAYFPGMKYVFDVGRKLARDYWDCRGTFVQLTTYPFTMEDDPMPTGSLCRMTYMTGWAANQYWFRYLYTLDTDWLATEGYPVLRDAALFYTDFLTKGDDGLYHAFPSGQGEYHYTGNAADYTDQPQVLRHARYSLQCAVEAARLLDADPELQAQWEERLACLTPADNLERLGYDEEALRRYRLNPPEFLTFYGPDIPTPQAYLPILREVRENPLWSWYFGHMPMRMMNMLRNRCYNADRDCPAFVRFLQRWRQPNGAIRAMSAQVYGYAGAWSESLGIIAPIQEMMLQSWDGIIRIFPAWPHNLDASFTTLRAQGAFLVSASWKNGRVENAAIFSERGATCRLLSPWPQSTEVFCGQVVDTRNAGEDCIEFDTQPGKTYELTRHRGHP